MDAALKDQLKKYRINPSEYDKICELLGRPPQGVEWAVYSALWSEHCSYKSSKVHLKNLFSKSDRVLQSFGENAGIVDLGEGEKVAFKMESHNHPSFIEPYQGAATGVGGILRDIFTMGARPIALANYLCFGEPKAPRMTELVDGVVRGIGGYGNCVGVPTVTGQTNFSVKYNNNILVNAMAVGLFVEGDPVCLSGAKGIGNLLVYVGAKTGRDGVHGASMASESFDEDSESKRPTVQIGDPFYEKLLIESCLEVMKKDLVVAIQDMGAAGLTSSSFEMAEKGGVGFEFYLDRVPLRDATMSPEDILLSESQERMLLICEPGKLEEIQQTFHRWGLDAVSVGEVIQEPVVRLHWHGEVIASVNPEQVVSNAPQYNRPFNKDVKRESAQDKPWPQAQFSKEKLVQILSDVRAGAKDWIFRQYDQRVGASTCYDCSSPVGGTVLPSGRVLGTVLGCRPSLMDQEAYIGGLDSILYPSLELAAYGFEPLAVTDCLNFANPEKIEVMTDFVESLAGMNQACEALVAPIISGNVSFYNETMDQGITPTPSTGLVGLRPHAQDLPQAQFTSAGDEIYLLQVTPGWWSGESAVVTAEAKAVSAPIKVQAVAEKIKNLATLCSENQIASSRVVGSFGLATTLARMSLATGLGAEVRCDQNPWTAPLYQVVFALKPEQAKAISQEFAKKDLLLQKIGQVTDQAVLKWNDVQVDVQTIKESYAGSWSQAFPELS